MAKGFHEWAFESAGTNPLGWQQSAKDLLEAADAVKTRVVDVFDGGMHSLAAVQATGYMLGCRCCPERAIKAAVSSPGCDGNPARRGTSAGSELVPQHSNRHARWRRQCARSSRQRSGPKTLSDSRLSASRSSRSDGAVCRPRACAPSRWSESGRERPRCCVARAAPGPSSVGVVHAPRCRCPTRRACSHPRPANPPAKPASFEHVSMSCPGCTQTAITSGSMRARRGAVQGSALRSDRAWRAARA
jgi:hypothetical protein